MPIRDLKDKINRLPEQPGVYLYSNHVGETIYVGRATVLRDRVRSYLGAYGSSPKTNALLDEVAGLEVIVTDSLVEALALENNLIKQRAPRYNILLRDDKNYPYLQVTTTEAFPRVIVARHVTRDGNFYAGPFLPASFARKTMALTHKLFGMRSCNEVITGNRGRPCLEYDIKRCAAPCVKDLCNQQEYSKVVRSTQMFLQGRNEELLEELRSQMASASNELRFEQAAQIRDAVRIIENLANRQQKMATAQLGDRDAFGVKVGPCGTVVQVFQMRRGRVVERIELVADKFESECHSEQDVVQVALQQFYEGRDVPCEVHVPVVLDDFETLVGWLSRRAGRRVRLYVPKRGEKKALLDLASRNASLAYASRHSENVEIHRAALDELRVLLELPTRPSRIECFDISTIQGAETVGSMVVSEDGRMQRHDYRKYRIRALKADTGHPNDFAAMEEVVFRRYRRLLEQGGPFPDLVIVDGGKGQLSSAYKSFEKLGLANLVAIGIAKQEELIVTRQREEPIELPRHSVGLQLVQRMRDEAHRFAVTFHRRARKMRDLHSVLDDVPGIGPKRRRRLLEQFGSVVNVRRASRDELQAVVGVKLADTLVEHLT
jgi:excinuclease ABC subunit C